MKKDTSLFLIGLNFTARQEAKLKAFCRIIDASLGEFVAYAIQSEMDFQLEHWKKRRVDQLERLSQSICKMSGDRPPSQQ